MTDGHKMGSSTRIDSLLYLMTELVKHEFAKSNERLQAVVVPKSTSHKNRSQLQWWARDEPYYYW